MRLRSIDFLRGASALIVVCGHALTAAPYHVFGRVFEEACVLLMWLAVNCIPLFFAVSGFCIHLGQVRHGGAFQFAAFWRRRIWRLYPTYFVALVASIGLLLVMLMAGAGAEMLARYPEPKGKWIAIDFAYHAVMLHGLHPFFDKGAGNPPLWTLAREEYLYLMYPLVLVMRRRMPWYSVSTLLAGITIVFQYWFTRFTTSPDVLWLLIQSAPALWIQWQVGVVAADAYRGEIQLAAFWRQARWVPVWMVLAYIFRPGTIFLALASFTLVNACVRLELEGRWPATGIAGAVTRVGLWSYSLYLVHFPVQVVALAIAHRVWPEQLGPAGFVARALVLVVISCFAGRLFFEIVERHFVTLPRRADNKPLAATATSVA